MAKTPIAVAAPLTLFIVACSGSSGPVCLPVERFALDIEVRDAHSDELRADSARGVAQDGTYRDSLLIVRYEGADLVPAALGGALGRPGTYALEIARPGYQLWDTAGVRVTADECGPITVHLLARLVAAT